MTAARRNQRHKQPGSPPPATARRASRRKPQLSIPKRFGKPFSRRFQTQKGFVRNSASAAHVLGVEGRNFILGFAPGDKPTMDILGTQANRKFVETLLHEISEKDWTLKLTVSEELASKSAAAQKDSPSHDFKDEPLIQDAIELFNARVTQER